MNVTGYKPSHHDSKLVLLCWILWPLKLGKRKANSNRACRVCLMSEYFSFLLPLSQESLPIFCCINRGYRLFTWLCPPLAVSSPSSTSDINLWYKSEEIKNILYYIYVTTATPIDEMFFKKKKKKKLYLCRSPCWYQGTEVEPASISQSKSQLWGKTRRGTAWYLRPNWAWCWRYLCWGKTSLIYPQVPSITLWSIHYYHAVSDFNGFNAMDRSS